MDPRQLLAEGREAEIYEWGEGRVLRLMRSADQRAAMDRSSAAIAAARAAGVPTPAVLDIVEIEGRPGQVMERVDGVDQFDLLGRSPWRLPSIARDLGRIHADLHRTVVSDDHPSLHELVAGRIERSTRVPDDIATAARRVLETLPDGTALCHGDLHPGNVLVGDHSTVVIDWTNASRGDAMADVARSRLMLRIGEIPDGAPAVVRVLAAPARAAFGRLYLRAYARAAPLDRALVDRWEPVRAADRLTEDIEGEREALLSIARRGLGLDRDPG